VQFNPPEIQADDEHQAGGPPVIGYFLEARTLNGPWIRVNKVPITGTEVRVVNLHHDDMRYEFRLTALNDNGCGEYSPASDAVHVVPFTGNRPSQPGRPVATLRGNSVSLQWYMWAGTKAIEQLRYVIRGREADTKRTVLYECTELSKAGTTVRHTLNNKTLKSDTEYEFAVAACNTRGIGPYSSYSSSVKTPPGWFHCQCFYHLPVRFRRVEFWSGRVGLLSPVLAYYYYSPRQKIPLESKIFTWEIITEYQLAELARSYSTSSRVSTEMGDRLRATQANSAWSSLRGWAK